MKKLSLSSFRKICCLLVLIGLCQFGFTSEANAQRSKQRRALTKRNVVKRGGINQPVPVVLIHGIGGADLDYRPPASAKKGVWHNGFPNDVLKGKFGSPQNLQFDESGNPRSESISKYIEAVKFFDVPGSDITDLSKYLQKNGYTKDVSLFEFFYDFRYSVMQSATLLNEFINHIKAETKSPQVDLVAHSMGGMIAKQYLIDKEANDANLRNLIFVAAPHLGAPKALKVLRYGDDLSVSLIDQCKMKRVAHNLPSLFNLLPGRRYFEVVGGYFNDAADLDDDGKTGVLNFDATVLNLKNGRETKCRLNAKIDVEPFDRLSASLVDEQLVKFHDSQDKWKKPENVRVVMIVGYGVPTLKLISEDKAGQITYAYTNGGDGTVPFLSAEAAPADRIYYVNLKRLNSNHAEMIGNPAVDAVIFRLLGQTGEPDAKVFSTARPEITDFTEIIGDK